MNGKCVSLEHPEIITTSGGSVCGNADPFRKRTGAALGGIVMIQYLTRHYDNLLRALAEHLQISWR